MIKGTTVKHCSGKNRGKTIKKHKTRQQAVKQHKAIMANKGKKK